MAPQLDTIDFNLSVGPHPTGELIVLAFEADEEVSRPFSVEVTLLVQPNLAVDFAALIGTTAVLSMQVSADNERIFHGVVADVRSWREGADNASSRCRLRIVPVLWTLGLNRRSRIFQDLAIPAIVKQVLSAAGIKQHWTLSANYQPRDYCVQYGESDLDFVSRLLEEVGIFYFFEHSPDDHTMMFSDAPTDWKPLQGGATIPFRPENGFVAGVEFIGSLQMNVELRPSMVTLRDFNFLTPAVDLTSSAPSKASGPTDGTTLEVYEYPGGYFDGGIGDRLARIRLDQARVDAAQTEGTSRSQRLMPGWLFELAEHPLTELNGQYQITKVRHRGNQTSGGTTAAGNNERYGNHFSCLPAARAYRPRRQTTRPVISGPQTALVVGDAGEEIHCDSLGRIKVQFHWDREGQNDAKSSCWVRVSQAWAGPGWGALYLPRVGQEVVVEFLEGDPDRPVVTGAVYNGVNPPPLSLPDEKTKSTLRSSSTPGGAGFNELRFDDAKGSEEVFLHAQKDLTLVIENDKAQTVGHNETLTVGGDRLRQIGGNQALQVGKNDSSAISGNQNIKVGKNRSLTVGGDHTETVGGGHTTIVGSTYSLNVGGLSSEMIAAGKDITVGGSYAVAVGGALNELVAGVKSEEVSGDKSETVAGSKTEKVGGTRSLSVGADLEEEIKGSRTLKLGKDWSLKVGGTLEQVVKDKYVLKAKELTIEATEGFLLKVGSATIEVKKSGDIDIKGAKVQLKASGELALKGSKISQN